MLKIFKIGLILLFVTLVACHQITQESFEKIQPGMSMQQVVKILGEPTDSGSINIAGISGTSASWKSKDATIVIQFINDKVAIKSFNKSGQAGSQQDLQINLNPDSSGNGNTNQ